MAFPGRFNQEVNPKYFKKLLLILLIMFSVLMLYEVADSFINKTEGTDVDIDKIKNKSKALILGKIILTPYEQVFEGKPIENRWTKIHPTLGTLQDFHYQFIGESKEICGAYMIDPGKYILTELSYKIISVGGGHGGSMKRYSHEGGNIDFRLKEADFVFYAKSGEVVYIGHIYVTHSANKWKIRVVDRFDEVKEYFQKEFPGLKLAIQKRLIDYKVDKIIHSKSFLD